MKSITTPLMFAIVMAFLCSAVSGCRNQNSAPAPATAEELSQMNKDFAKALNAKDAASAANLYFEDGTLLPPNELLVSGRENIQKYWQAGIDSGVSDVSVETISTGSNGDLGYEIGRYRLNVHQRDGKVVSENGKYIELLKRSEEGKWKSIYGIWNSDTPAVD